MQHFFFCYIKHFNDTFGDMWKTDGLALTEDHMTEPSDVKNIHTYIRESMQLERKLKLEIASFLLRFLERRRFLKI